MKEHKFLIIFSTIVGIISLVFAIYFFNVKDVNMYYDISISIFTGVIVMLCTSIISYSIIKRKTLETFYEEVQYIIKEYIDLQDYRDKNLETKIDGILKLSEINYLELDRSFGNITFLFDKGKGRKIIAELYHYIGYAKETIGENIFHLRLHKRGEGTNKEELLNRFIKPTY